MDKQGLSATDLLVAGRARGRAQTSGGRRDLRVRTVPPSRGRYLRVVYLTEDHHRWARAVTGAAGRQGLSLSRSDVLRLALAWLRAEVDEQELSATLVALARAESYSRPGHRKRSG